MVLDSCGEAGNVGDIPGGDRAAINDVDLAGVLRRDVGISCWLPKSLSMKAILVAPQCTRAWVVIVCLLNEIVIDTTR